MFEYLQKIERDVAVAAIYGALLRLFESKGGSHARAGVPEKLSCTLSRGNDAERFATRIVFDIMDAENHHDLSTLPREPIARYTALLAQIASSRYSAGNSARSEAARFLKRIDREAVDSTLAVGK